MKHKESDRCVIEKYYGAKYVVTCEDSSHQDWINQIGTER